MKELKPVRAIFARLRQREVRRPRYLFPAHYIRRATVYFDSLVGAVMTCAGACRGANLRFELRLRRPEKRKGTFVLS